MGRGGNGVRKTKAQQQKQALAKNQAAVAAVFERRRADEAAMEVVTDTRPEQEPIDEDPSPVLAESTLAPAPTPLPATPLPATPLIPFWV